MPGKFLNFNKVISQCNQAITTIESTIKPNIILESCLFCEKSHFLSKRKVLVLFIRDLSCYALKNQTIY